MVQADSRAFERHGGRLDDARRAWPAAPAPWIDLSTGINPRPWSPPPGLHHDAGPLPTRSDLAGLEVAAAGHFGVAAERVMAVPGSEIALRLLPALDLPRPITTFLPTYGTHGDVAESVRHEGPIALTTGTLLLANPNNPDGCVFSPAWLIDLAEQQRRIGGWLVVDEAFVDATPEASILRDLEADAPVLVTRSFGKFFGLAGVRLGFFIGSPALLARLRRLVGDWPVSAQAIAWGSAAYSNSAWIADALADLHQQADRLDALLAKHGLPATGGCPLFRLVDHVDAHAIFERLARSGILTRPFTDHPRWLRFGLPGNDDAFDRLDRALADG